LFDSGGASFPIAEGTHPGFSPSLQVRTTGNASNGQLFPGTYHIHTHYVLRVFDGVWGNLSGNCTGVGTQIASCDDNTPEFQLVGCRG
jgi:hypothetical protein